MASSLRPSPRSANPISEHQHAHPTSRLAAGRRPYGRVSHRVRMLVNKPAVFNAVNDCAVHLIASGYTRPERLAVFGYSKGGLLVGGAVARWPDLYAAAMPAVVALDLRRFTQFTNGRLWTREYGHPQGAAFLRSVRLFALSLSNQPPLGATRVEEGSRRKATFDVVSTPAGSGRGMRAVSSVPRRRSSRSTSGQFGSS
nr:prolyl oligopeptidase family serine peptidase [Brevundimonas naejangsanensis]